MSICETIQAQRERLHISQEKLAEAIGVSKGTVQKWESGLASPGCDDMQAMAAFFGVSLRELALPAEEPEPLPTYDKIHEWEAYMNMLNVEYTQSLEEGLDVQPLKSLFDGAAALPRGPEKQAAADLIFRLIRKAKTVEGYPYVEPSDLATIRALRDDFALPKACKKPGSRALREKIRGAWYGRIAGCLLGKPIEGIRRDELARLMEETGNKPLSRYFTWKEVEPVKGHFKYGLGPWSYPDVIANAPADDDTNYTVLSQRVIADYGRDFTPANMAAAWRRYQSINAYCTAERVAFRNFCNGFLPPQSAVYQNAYREWIGAQIRGDYFGYINPGDPETAADMAWRDACISHVKNGIYGEMFIAAALACAAVTDDMETVIRGGLHQIPATSRLYEAVTAIIDLWKQGADYDACMAKILERYDDRKAHDWCHTISNAMIVTAALLCGDGDYGRSICLAVQSGFDTDCNGATVGSIVGMLKGASAIGSEWTEPLHGKLDTAIFRVGTVRIEDAVNQTLSDCRA